MLRNTLMVVTGKISTLDRKIEILPKKSRMQKVIERIKAKIERNEVISDREALMYADFLSDHAPEELKQKYPTITAEKLETIRKYETESYEALREKEFAEN